ncbi:ABC transporter ATP-binding protein [Fuerstiella marisgermanici]|uniref:Bicarbonate transport ATP-binding protein CmpD n=1 Tax=Fuerstiella marisgermanici TaxID=1891926 RepID=A0A1P8WPK1_9PLAN|nr:ABC transporter ATP-binding protein [Fuerstiella marisgermanici]APZ95982.1 Bicarbonate transport ATP-binding protein CmpD [Fuerstiella marisgermanici]
MKPSSAKLSISDLRFRFAADGPDVLHVPQLTVPNGQFVSILGSSGCGKSTLLRLIAGLLNPGHGTLFPTPTPNADSQRQHGDVGMVFQSANLVPWRTARQNVLLPAELGRTRVSVSDERLSSLFRLVGLREQDTHKRSSALSGGMQMRVSLARALVLQPSLLLMDEPFAALDDLLRMQLEEDVRRIHHERSLTTVLVTHNIQEAVFMSDRVVVLGGQPSSIQADIEVSLPSDRDWQLRANSAFHELVNTVTEALHATSGDRTAAEVSL